MRQITCPVCNSQPSEVPDSMTRVACPSCQIQWTFISEEIDSDSLYRDEVYAVVDNRASIFEKIIFSEAKKVLQKARKILGAGNHLLDFGSGKGQFLKVAKDLDWKGLGIETEKARADFAQEKYQVSVRSEFYSGGIIPPGKFELITLNHVLEHLPRPIFLLQELLESNLASDGLTYIEVPRADSWQAKLAGKQWMHWDIPKHLSHWNEKSLEKELGKIGFSPVGKRSFSIHLGVLGMLQAILSLLGFRENLILRLKRKKTVGLILLIGLTLPIAWILEVLATGFGKSGIMGIYFQKNEK